MTTLGEIQQMASHFSGREPFAIVDPEEYFKAASNSNPSPEVLKLLEEMRLYMPYLQSQLWFDISNTVRDTGLQAPPVRSYFHRFIHWLEENMSRGS